MNYCRAAFFCTALLAATAAADAPALDVLVCYPASAVSARDAEPALKEMVSVIESIGGWPAGTVKAHFTTRLSECQKKLDALQPPFAFLPLGTFLRNHQSHQLRPLVQPRLAASSEDSYHLVVRGGTFSTLDDLRGKKVGGPWLEDLEFLRRVVFAGKLDPQKDFHLSSCKRALKALRQLASGKLDAVLLNRQQAKSLSELPFGRELKIIYDSEPLPQVGLVADVRRASEADRQKMQKAMEAMCSHQKGKKLCELFNLESFVESGPDAFARAIERWQSVP